MTQVCFQKAKTDDEVQEQGGAAAAADVSKAATISQILKRNMIENCIPILVGLKHLMEKERSPFIREVRECLRRMVADYREDLSEVLKGDATLLRELQYDIQRVDGKFRPLKSGAR